MLYNTFVLRLLGEEVPAFYPKTKIFIYPRTKIERKYIQQNSFSDTHVVKNN